MIKFLILSFCFLGYFFSNAQSLRIPFEFIPTAYSYSDTILKEDIIREIRLFDSDSALRASILFFENGNIEACINYDKDANFDGANIQWYENGQMEYQSFFNEGKLTGNNNFTWYENSEIESQTSCRNDTCVTTYFHPTGEIKGISKSIGMMLFYEKSMCKNGIVIFDDLIGKRRNYEVYYCNENLKIRTQKNEKDAFVGEYRSWYEDGTLEKKGQYSEHNGFHSLKEGKWLYYDRNGSINRVETYKSNKLINTEDTGFSKN